MKTKFYQARFENNVRKCGWCYELLGQALQMLGWLMKVGVTRLLFPSSSVLQPQVLQSRVKFSPFKNSGSVFTFLYHRSFDFHLLFSFYLSNFLYHISTNYTINVSTVLYWVKISSSSLVSGWRMEWETYIQTDRDRVYQSGRKTKGNSPVWLPLYRY